MKKFIYLLMTLVPLLFFSCAGGTSSADGDVGYLSFGSSRAIGLSYFSITTDQLESLTLKGTRNGKTTTLGSWTSCAEAEGESIPVQAGSWTFELIANKGMNYFSSTQKAVIKSGQSNVVAFTLSFAGVPANRANTGYIILSNGYAISTTQYNQCPELVAKYPPEAVAIVATTGVVYGINLNISSTKINYTAVQANAPAGYSIPPKEMADALNSTSEQAISTAFTAVGCTYPNSGYFWTTFPSGTTGHYTYFFFGTSAGGFADVGGGGGGSLYVKQF